MPVVGLRELRLDPLATGICLHGHGSRINPWCHVLVRSLQLEFPGMGWCASTQIVLGLIFELVLMAIVIGLVFLLTLRNTGGAGWTLAASELWIAGQRAMPEWARGRMNATIIVVSQAGQRLSEASSRRPRRDGGPNWICAGRGDHSLVPTVS